MKYGNLYWYLVRIRISSLKKLNLKKVEYLNLVFVLMNLDHCAPAGLAATILFIFSSIVWIVLAISKTFSNLKSSLFNRRHRNSKDIFLSLDHKCLIPPFEIHNFFPVISMSLAIWFVHLLMNNQDKYAISYFPIMFVKFYLKITLCATTTSMKDMIVIFKIILYMISNITFNISVSSRAIFSNDRICIKFTVFLES